MSKPFQPTKRKSMQKMIGSVPYSTVIGKNDKGRFIAQANIGGKQYEATGETSREATLALSQQVDLDAKVNDVPHNN